MESSKALYFPEVKNLNGLNADMCSDVAGPSRSSLNDLSELSGRSNENIILPFPLLLVLLAAILDLSLTTTPILPSGRVTSSFIKSTESYITLQGQKRGTVAMLTLKSIPVGGTSFGFGKSSLRYSHWTRFNPTRNKSERLPEYS